MIGTRGERPDATVVIESPEAAEQLESDGKPIAVITQTTLSLDDVAGTVQALERRFGPLRRPGADDICYATQNRQDAVKELIRVGIDLLLVVGSRNSSNSIRLCEVARAQGVESHLIDNASEIQPQWLTSVRSIGLTAGASAPDYLVEDVVNYLKSRGATEEELEVIKEDVSFALPRELLTATATPA